ncbi:hypothetical protein DAEQUDRAFT_720630 [Daedalea quercina L-15889]|uniref:Serine/threonine-protein phosphatase 1 regulatory subunit 10 n=1 Tax=Daedalea quercina L-15889 TaxID=1314783 RepID=A0A165U6F4_9APHY|nr:hypothetical protein DAEQUDRAFT_720630 [Daedalea quercina L-15889]
MEFSNTAWLQPPIADLQQHVATDGQRPANDEWKDPSSTSGAAAAMDLSEFGLGDLSVPSSASTSNASSTTPLYTFGQHTAYYPGPFNAVSYSTSQWNNPATQLPLSSYSSLNGATSASPSGQQQQSASSTMMIDPALTTMNGSSSSPPQQYQHTTPFLSSQSLSPQLRTQFQYQHQPQQSTFSINPPYVHTTSAHFQQSPVPRPASQQQYSQSQQQQHATLSPYVLQSNSLLSALPPSSFYGIPMPAPSPPKPATPTPEQRKAAFQTAIKPLLTPTSFTGAGAVSQLTGHIFDYGMTEVEASIRLEILTRMRDNAGNHYFRAWVENEDAMEITREWLKSAYAGKDDSQHLETIMPMLHIIDRLPMTLECLKASKLGKVIVRLVKDPPAPAIKDMASNLERKWRQLLVSSHEDSKRMDVDDDPKGKKRKADATSAKSAPALKKAAVSTSTTSTKPVAVKKEAKPVVKEVKDAKSDSSFFSAPKPKPKLPSFKKAPPPATVKKEPDPNVAQPSSFNPFEEALKSMAKSRKDSPATATPPPAPASAPPTSASTSLSTNGKPRKRVTWAPEGELERIKLIERAIYDDDPADGLLSTHNVRDLDRDEGAALHAHLFEEQVEWSEPILIQMPPEIDVRPRGTESQEKVAQEEREQGALVALYVSETQIPASPDEPPTQLTEEQTDEGVKVMLTGPDVDAIFWTAGAPAAVEPPKQSVAELVGQLAAASGVDAFTGSTSAGAPQQLDAKPFGLDTNAIQAMPGVSNLNPEQLQQLVQALSQNQSGTFQPEAPGQPAPSAEWNHGRYPPDYDRSGGGYHDEGPHDRRWPEDGGWAERGSGGGRGGHRGRGRGRGRGGEPYRNNKRRPCSFFAAGRCKYGDQCDFSHEPIY